MNVEEIGDLALREYKSVKYFPFGNEAGSPFILTADPLGYLEAWLDKEYDSIHRDRSQSKKKNLKKAIYFTQLSKDFYNSAQGARMPSKGTLIYYSFINLVKVYLIIKGHELESKVEHHGLTLPSEFKDKLRLINLTGEGISIFHEFAKCIGKEINNSDGLEINFSSLLNSLPEVHEIGYALNLFPGTKRRFLPIDVIIRTTANRKKIFYTISYEKKFDKQMKVDKLLKGICSSKFYKIEIENDPYKNHFKSNIIISYTSNSKISWKKCYPKIVKDLNELNVTPMLTRQGYRNYIDLEPTRFHRLSSVLAFAYYLGTIARYRPTLNEEILKGKYQSIINEAIIACPQQFFYLMVSHITKQVCAIPMSKID
jgi:hypothetical protein